MLDSLLGDWTKPLMSRSRPTETWKLGDLDTWTSVAPENSVEINQISECHIPALRTRHRNGYGYVVYHDRIQ